MTAKSLSVSRVSDSVFGEAARSSLSLEGLLLLLEKINLLSAGVAGLRGQALVSAQSDVAGR